MKLTTVFVKRLPFFLGLNVSYNETEYVAYGVPFVWFQCLLVYVNHRWRANATSYKTCYIWSRYNETQLYQQLQYLLYRFLWDVITFI